MTVQQSSISAYNASVRSGKIPSQRRRIWNLLMHKGPMTNRMIATVLRMETASVSARIHSMIESDLVIPLKEHASCPITKRRVRWVQVVSPQQMEMRI